MTLLETKMDHLVSKMGYLETKMVSLFATIIPLILILVFSTATLGAHAIPTDEIKAAHAGLADVLTDEMPWDSLANGLPTVAKARALWPAGCHALKATIPPIPNPIRQTILAYVFLRALFSQKNGIILDVSCLV